MKDPCFSREAESLHFIITVLVASLSEKRVSKPFFQVTDSAKMSSEMALSAKLPNKLSKTKRPMRCDFIYIQCKLPFQDFRMELSLCIDKHNNIKFYVTTVVARQEKNLSVPQEQIKCILQYIHSVQPYAAKKWKQFFVPSILLCNDPHRGRLCIQFVVICIKTPMHVCVFRHKIFLKRIQETSNNV